MKKGKENGNALTGDEYKENGKIKKTVKMEKKTKMRS